MELSTLMGKCILLLIHETLILELLLSAKNDFLEFSLEHQPALGLETSLNSQQIKYISVILYFPEDTAEIIYKYFLFRFHWQEVKFFCLLLTCIRFMEMK